MCSNAYVLAWRKLSDKTVNIINTNSYIACIIKGDNTKAIKEITQTLKVDQDADSIIWNWSKGWIWLRELWGIQAFIGGTEIE